VTAIVPGRQYYDLKIEAASRAIYAHQQATPPSTQASKEMSFQQSKEVQQTGGASSAAVVANIRHSLNSCMCEPAKQEASKRSSLTECTK
jgi:hypothetical protein